MTTYAPIKKALAQQIALIARIEITRCTGGQMEQQVHFTQVRDVRTGRRRSVWVLTDSRGWQAVGTSQIAGPGVTTVVRTEVLESNVSVAELNAQMTRSSRAKHPSERE
jgi:hypothetical protein